MLAIMWNEAFELLLTFLKIGFLGFGGGYAMLSLIAEEVLNLGLTFDQFKDLTVLDVLIPGPIAINAATYVGYIVAGIFGAFVATTSVTVPSYTLVPLYLHYEKKIDNNRIFDGIVNSVKGASVGLIGAVAVRMFLSSSLSIEELIHMKDAKIDFFLLSISVIGFILHDKLKINAILLTIFAAAAGILYYYIIH